MTRQGAVADFIRKACRYGAVSLVCFIINNLLLIGLDFLGQPLWVSLLISAAIMIVLGFALQSTFTFAVPMRSSAFVRYAVMMLPNVPAAYVLLWMLNEQLSLAMYYAAPVTTALMVIWNFAGSAWALRKRARSA